MTAFWGMAPPSLVEVDRPFRGTHCLHHQGNSSHPKSMLSSYSPSWEPVISSSVLPRISNMYSNIWMILCKDIIFEYLDGTPLWVGSSHLNRGILNEWVAERNNEWTSFDIYISVSRAEVPPGCPLLRGGGELFVWGTYLNWTKYGQKIKYMFW
jgi:hypothetical protein